jgi:hypothetical protein
MKLSNFVAQLNSVGLTLMSGEDLLSEHTKIKAFSAFRKLHFGANEAKGFPNVQYFYMRKDERSAACRSFSA